MLSQTDIEKIDQTAKELLENPGVRVEDEEIVEKLLRNPDRKAWGLGFLRGW